MQQRLCQMNPDGFEEEIIIPCESRENYNYFEQVSQQRDLKVKFYQ